MADSKLTALSEVSVPELEDLSYFVEDPGGTPTSRKVTMQRLFGLLAPFPQGRLTTESGVPISTSDRSSQGTLYWKPCTAQGEPVTSVLVPFYDGTRYVVKSVSQLSLDLSTAEAGGAIDVNEIYDVFIDYNGGSPQLVIGPSWSSNTARATALAEQGSLVVLTGDTDWTWVGTIRASASGVVDDSLTKRFVWNAHNRVMRRVHKSMGSSSHAYNSTTVRQYNADDTAQVEVVAGVAGLAAVMSIEASMQNSGATYIRIGIGENSTTAYSFAVTAAHIVNGTLNAYGNAGFVTLRAGYSALSLNEDSSASNTHTFDQGRISGMVPC